MEIISARALLVGAKGRFTKNQEMLEALSMGIETFDKQMPKKPINESTWKACPTCTQGIGVDSNTPNPRAIEYCFHCGQKLDWD
ncbi:MAG TPA: hypothetical protein DD811_01745 [Syntrophomonas sp.]|jgi:hypothetical protein|nr:hypothetical protein [Syntrophomonas sp.]